MRAIAAVDGRVQVDLVPVVVDAEQGHRIDVVVEHREQMAEQEGCLRQAQHVGALLQADGVEARGVLVAQEADAAGREGKVERGAGVLGRERAQHVQDVLFRIRQARLCPVPDQQHAGRPFRGRRTPRAPAGWSSARAPS